MRDDKKEGLQKRGESLDSILFISVNRPSHNVLFSILLIPTKGIF